MTITTTRTPATPATRVPPPPKHQMALMIWLSVFPALIALQLLLHDLLADAPMILRTLILTSIAVPVVVYVLMPALQRLRTHLITRRSQA